MERLANNKANTPAPTQQDLALTCQGNAEASRRVALYLIQEATHAVKGTRATYPRVDDPDNIASSVIVYLYAQIMASKIQKAEQLKNLIWKKTRWMFIQESKRNARRPPTKSADESNSEDDDRTLSGLLISKEELPGSSLDQEDTNAILETVLPRLSPRYELCLRLFLRGFDVRAIGQVLKTSDANVHLTRWRAIRALGQCLTDEERDALCHILQAMNKKIDRDEEPYDR